MDDNIVIFQILTQFENMFMVLNPEYKLEIGMAIAVQTEDKK